MGTWSVREFYEWTEQECPEDDEVEFWNLESVD
jgi:hypothetical protein